MSIITFLRGQLRNIAVAACLLISCWHRGDTYIGFQYSIGLALCSIPIAIAAARKFGILFGVFSGYVLAHCANGITNFYGKNVHLPFEFQNQVSITTAFSLLYALMIFLGIASMSEKLRNSVRLSIGAIAAIDGGYVIYSYFTGFRLSGGFGFTGFLDYCGMNGTMMALGVAFLLPATQKISYELAVRLVAISITVTGIFLSKTAIPFGVLGLVFASYVFSKNKPRAFVPVAVMAAVLIAGWFTVGSKMFNSSGRFQAYGVFFDFLKSEKRLMFGVGMGTLKDYALTAQSRSGFMMGDGGGWLFDKLHSDALQCWFELGLPAFVMAILIYFQCLFRLYRRKDHVMFAFGVGLAGALSVNYPLRYFITSLMAAFFVVESLIERSSKIE